MPNLGIRWPVRYGQYLLGVSNAGALVAERPERMHNWRGFALDLLGTAAPGLVTPLLIILSLAPAGLVLWLWWRIGRVPVDDGALQADLAFALTCIAAMLLAPHFHEHDLLLLIVPAWIIAAYTASGIWSHRWSRRWTSIFWLGWLLPLLAFFLPLGERVPVIASVALLITILLLLLCQIYPSTRAQASQRTNASTT